jgi:signal transduction histidine kinase
VTLRSRLAWTYAVTLALVVVGVAVLFTAVIDRTLRGALDGRLRTTAEFIGAVVDVHDGRLHMDADDRRQMLVLLGGAMEGGVFTAQGTMYAVSSNAIPPPVLRIVRENGKAPFLATGGSGERTLRISLMPIVRGGVVYGSAVAWTGSDYISDFERDAIVLTILAAIVVGGVAAFLSSVLTRRALAPLERLGALATEIEAHDLSRRIGVDGSDELGKLSGAFDRMLDRLEAAFARQRRFTADASHELRAPLAVIRAEADAALGKEHTHEEYRLALESIVGEVSRIDALVDALLLAARADSTRASFRPVDAGEIAMLAAHRLEPAAGARGIHIATDADEAVVMGDAQALERAVAAIVHNAIDFARERIDVAVRRTGGHVRLTVTDDGPGFSEDALDHALERFWRADPGRPRGGTGLGLSIADAVVRAHGGGIALENVEPHGARVVVTLR